MKKSIFLMSLCFICLGFIFFNSSQSGTSSNKRSNILVDKIVMEMQESNFNNILGIKDEISNYELNLIVRKCAHAFEFFMLSIVVGFTFKFFKIGWKNIIIYTLFIILLCAVSDEFFQIYISGRNSSVYDIIIDFIGGIIGIIILCLFSKIYKIYKKIVNRKL